MNEIPIFALIGSRVYACSSPDIKEDINLLHDIVVSVNSIIVVHLSKPCNIFVGDMVVMFDGVGIMVNTEMAYVHCLNIGGGNESV